MLNVQVSPRPRILREARANASAAFRCRVESDRRNRCINDHGFWSICNCDFERRQLSYGNRKWCPSYIDGSFLDNYVEDHLVDGKIAIFGRPDGIRPVKLDWPRIRFGSIVQYARLSAALDQIGCGMSFYTLGMLHSFSWTNRARHTAALN